MKKEYLIYILLILNYYVIPPLFIIDTGSGMFILLIFVPLMVFFLSLLYSKIKGFKWYFSIVVSLLWIPSVYIFYNDSALVYCLIYCAVSFTGQLIGNFFKKQ